jgi:dTDP-glucose 4,6-dehydratase
MVARVLITGSCGFVGHYILEKLIKDTDFEVVGLERMNHSGNINRIKEVVPESESGRYTIIWHDLRSPIHGVLSSQIGLVDYIIHVAASSHVDRSITDPLSFVYDNVVGTCNILEFARKQENLKKFIYFSTDEVFGPAPPGVYYDEYARYNSTNPYSASKAGGEELAVAYRNTYGVPVVVTHTMNVFGSRQHPEKFIPKCINNINNGENVIIHSDSTLTIPGSRFYIHGADVADGILFIMTKDPDAGGNGQCPKFNLVGKEETTNIQLAQYIADAVGKPLKYEFVDFHSSRPGHDLRYALSGDRLRAAGWEPSMSLSDRIKEVVQWSMENPFWTTYNDSS